MDDILKQFNIEITKANSTEQIDAIRVKYLGKKSYIAMQLSSLADLSGSDRAQLGMAVNKAKAEISNLINDRKDSISSSQIFDMIDISKPGTALYQRPLLGHMHPSNIVLKETYQIFTELGFAIVDSPEIEDDWHNFESLNMPEVHPARETHDTFYIKDTDKKLLPRTHTSPMQVRFMNSNKPPFKVLISGKAFRNENEDATHSWSFGQIEGIVVAKGISVTDLKGTLAQIISKQLGENTQIRYRPSFFPYTEPSMEVDAKFNGKWLELGGAGMIHPKVLQNGGIDPEEYSGFAFGWGVERIAVIKYGINDLRQLWRPKLSYLEQF